MVSPCGLESKKMVSLLGFYAVCFLLFIIIKRPSEVSFEWQVKGTYFYLLPCSFLFSFLGMLSYEKEQMNQTLSYRRVGIF